MPATARPWRRPAPFLSAKPLLCRGVQTRYALPDSNAAEGPVEATKASAGLRAEGHHAYTSLRDVRLKTAVLPLTVEPVAVFSDPGRTCHSAERGSPLVPLVREPCERFVRGLQQGRDLAAHLHGLLGEQPVLVVAIAPAFRSPAARSMKPAHRPACHSRCSAPLARALGAR